MEDERDEGQAPTAILARLDELPHLNAQLRSRFVADEPAGALKYAAVAELLDLGIDFFGPATQPGSESRGVKHGIRIAVKEHEDIPRQKRPDVALRELCDRRS
jgi:hypothetical protein